MQAHTWKRHHNKILRILRYSEWEIKLKLLHNVIEIPCKYVPEFFYSKIYILFSMAKRKRKLYMKKDSSEFMVFAFFLVNILHTCD